MTMWIGGALLVAVLLALGWAAMKVIGTFSAFVSELRAARPDAGNAAVVPLSPSLQDAETCVLGARFGFGTVKRRLWWELVGFGNPSLRQRDLVAACGELLQAQRAMRALHEAHPHLALDPGPELGFADDPMRALAANGQWWLWFPLMLLPNPIRGTFVFLRVRGAVAPLLERATALEDQLRIVRTQFATSHSLPPALDRLATA